MRKLPCPVVPQPAMLASRPYLDALDALTKCRGALGLAASSLAVLRALVSFLPKTPQSPLQSHLVWPSNASLAERANGMEERTLRRHLAHLVEAGLITRHASANGKRFALRLRKTVVMAFGFDLSPLVHRKDELQALAEEAQATAEQIAVSKARLRALLQLDGIATLPEARRTEIRKLLRRDVGNEILAAAIDSLEAMLAPTEAPAHEMTATNSEIDRHQQKTEEDSFVLTASAETQTPKPTTFADCLDATSESRAFAVEPVRTWHDLDRLGSDLAPMIGIRPDLLAQARKTMGHLAASLSVLCLIQRGSRISQPAAYFRRLTQLAEIGAFSLNALIQGARKTRFAAANPELAPGFGL